MPETSNRDNKNSGQQKRGRKSRNQQDLTDLSSEFEFEAVPPKIETAPDYGRRIRALMGAILIIGIAYTAAWFGLGKYIENKVRTIAENSGIGCRDASAMGYPFRIGISCSKVSLAIETQSGKAIVEAANFRTAAQIYQPGLLIGEVDSPVTFTGINAAAMSIDFQSAMASVRASSALPSRFSINVISPEWKGLPTTVTADDFQVHMRKGDANLIEFAAFINSIKAGNAPLANLTFDAAIAGASRIEAAIENNGDVRQAILGSEGELRNLTLSFSDQGKLHISGPFTIGGDGLLSGKIAITIENGTALGPAVALLLKSFGTDIPAIGNMLAGAGEGTSNIAVTIQRGAASIGFIPLGQIPSL